MTDYGRGAVYFNTRYASREAHWLRQSRVRFAQSPIAIFLSLTKNIGNREDFSAFWANRKVGASSFQEVAQTFASLLCRSFSSEQQSSSVQLLLFPLTSIDELVLRSG